MPLITLDTGETVRLGRNRPKAIFEIDRYVIVVGQDDSVKVKPKFSAHYDYKLDVDPAPYTDWSPKALAALARMYLNDTKGCCVIAGKGHSVGIWSGNETGTPIQATDDEIDQNYTSICGPGDQGCNISDVLDAMKAGKFIMAGQPAKIDDYAAVDNSNQNLVMVALEVFGPLTIGVNLTSDCTNAGPGVMWNFAGSIVGGHDVSCYATTAQGVLVSTWGKVGTCIPWAVFQKKVTSEAGVEECWAMLAPTWYSKNNLAPNGVNAATLLADLDLMRNGGIPPLPGLIIPGQSPIPVMHF